MIVFCYLKCSQCTSVFVKFKPKICAENGKNAKMVIQNKIDLEIEKKIIDKSIGLYFKIKNGKNGKNASNESKMNQS